MKPDTSRRGFTLIELLIVTVVIATLMGIVFRLAGSGSDNRRRAVTIDRMQRIENALSGYYAAYGSYPPVPLQGRSRSVRKKVNYGIQEPGRDETGQSFGSAGNAEDAWKIAKQQVLAACRAQPVAVYFPFNDKDDDVRETVQELSNQVNGHFDLIRSGNAHGMNIESDDWSDFPVFQFGLLSFLLPRYLFMLDGDPDLYDVVNSKTKRRCGQWNANNQLPCRMDTGEQYRSWKEMQEAMGAHRSAGSRPSGAGASMISNLTSQSVCARWMPNFEGIISGGRTFYGVSTQDKDSPYLSQDTDRMGIFPRKGYQEGSGGGELVLLDGMTVRDGWGNEFYYYSEPPFKSYRLWSAGADGKTFPVWYDRSRLSDKELKFVREWTEDDISGLNN